MNQIVLGDIIEIKEHDELTILGTVELVINRPG